MEPLSTFEIIGITICVILASVLLCIVSYACQLGWILLIPVRILLWICKQFTYDNDDHGTCCGCGNSNYVV